MKILVTGAGGFVGRNLVENLKTIRDGKNRTRPELNIETIYEYGKENTVQDLERFCKDCDFVFHFAGVNRPTDPREFRVSNVDLAASLISVLERHGNNCPVMVLSERDAHPCCVRQEFCRGTSHKYLWLVRGIPETDNHRGYRVSGVQCRY